MPLDVDLSPLDGERFGVRVAKAAGVRADTLDEIVRYCLARAVDLLIARCPTGDIDAVHALEARGFRLMDCLCYYARDLKHLPSRTARTAASIRVATAADGEAVEDVAARAFRGHRGHYHADPRLDESACDTVYSSWARGSCESDDTEVLVAVDRGVVIGFATLRFPEPGLAEGVLAAVAPPQQGRGVYRELIIERLHHARRLGATRTIVSTHVANVGPQACWTSLGYRPHESSYTFHRWFDERVGGW